MKKFLYTLLLLCFGIALFAQQRTIIELKAPFVGDEIIAVNIPNIEQVPELTTLALRTSAKNPEIYFKVIMNENDSTEWEDLNRNAHFQKEDKNWVSELIFLKKDSKKIALKISNPEELDARVEIIFYQEFPSAIEKDVSMISYEKNIRKSSCPCPQPDFLDRAAWCPLGNCTPHPNPEFTDVTHLIVHHAASTNVSSNWSGVVRSIWDYHVNTNGWDDIGYNWLIDPNGLVYEGRGDDIRGAHFCGTNSNTLGICMLGDFQLVAPQIAALEKLKEFLSWKTCDVEIDPLDIAFHPSSGLQLNRISGHRQGCSTECPGEGFFPLFNQLRIDVDNYRTNECEEFLAPSDLEATFVADEKVELNWKDNASNETAFLLERAELSTNNYTMLATIGADVTNYSDETIALNTAYFYKLRAANSTDTTNYSNEVGIATVVASQSNVQAQGIEIFPNPAKEYLQIISASQHINDLHIINMQGQIVHREKDILQNEIRIGIKNIPNGVYMIQLLTKNGKLVQKLQIQH